MSHLAVCLLLLASPPAHRGGEPWPAALAVVKTWQDLESQPAIDLGNKVRIRLGIEANKAPLSSGVFLYCLAEGYDPPESLDGHDDVLGPVHFSFPARAKKELVQVVRAQRKLLPRIKEAREQGRLLFARPLILTDTGSYDVEVRNGAGRLLARCTVEGTKENQHPWTVLKYAAQKKAWSPSTSIAFPASAYGFEPYPLPEGLLRKDAAARRKVRLPMCVPAAPDPGFQAALLHGKLFLSFDREVETSHAWTHLLVRWWVDGKPYVPSAPPEEFAISLTGRVTTDTKLVLPLEIDTARLGAKKGARISLQVLYCGGGWDWGPNGAMLKAMRQDGGPDVRLSNRIDFVADR
jgi:hypothetical protein